MGLTSIIAIRQEKLTLIMPGAPPPGDPWPGALPPGIPRAGGGAPRTPIGAAIDLTLGHACDESDLSQYLSHVRLGLAL